MLIRYAPGRTGPGQRLRRAVRAVLSLPTALRMALDPCYPWINAGAVRWLRAHLSPGMVGFEWGSGRSTAFAARQVARLVTVEHKEKWRRRVRQLLARQGVTNVACRFVPPGSGPGRPEARPDIWRQTGYVLEKPEFAAYADAILDFPPDSLDFALIDGRARVACAYNAFCRIKPGGFLVLDNSEWEKYAPVFAAVPGWERLDFENGVWRTSILRRPGGPDGRNG
uniref:Class I SAM-dependent methyltransferase n=1 Tax=Desulfovibrio sp. U5L TaxID=596152 RepID=I2PZ43_9BACT